MQSMRELLERIRESPGMYLGCPSLTRLASYLNGYYHGLCQHNPTNPDDLLPSFGDWVIERYPPEESARGWDHVIRTKAGSDDVAGFDLFWDFLDEFLRENEQSPIPAETNGAAARNVAVIPVR